jgi:putative ATP-dependent endonuclease of OLD family
MEDGKKLGEKRILDLLPLLVSEKKLNGKKPAELLSMAPSVGLFVNEHTFEVDLFKCGRVRSMCKTLVELGESQAARDRAEAWRKAPEKLDVPRFLGDIERIGKGRFAQRLASNMTKNNCPEYIKEAIDHVITFCS